jgi:hypothetical protein
MPPRKRELTVKVALRPQSPEELTRFSSEMRLFLKEWARRYLRSTMEKNHENPQRKAPSQQ